MLHINAAFRTSQKKSLIAWTKYETDSHKPSFNVENHVQLDIIGDGKFRTYTVDLTSAPNYTGAMSYLMIKPIEKPEKGGWVKIKRSV